MPRGRNVKFGRVDADEEDVALHSSKVELSEIDDEKLEFDSSHPAFTLDGSDGEIKWNVLHQEVERLHKRLDQFESKGPQYDNPRHRFMLNAALALFFVFWIIVGMIFLFRASAPADCTCIGSLSSSSSSSSTFFGVSSSSSVP